MIKTLPIIIVPLITAFCGFAVLKRGELYDEFIDGIKDGIRSALSLLPTLIGLLTAVAIFNASGAADYLAELAGPLLSRMGVPGELTSLLLTRPISGGASGAMFDELLAEYGADSFVGRCASVIVGSSDTVIYIIALCFGSVGVKKSGCALVSGLLASVFCVILSCCAVRLLF